MPPPFGHAPTLNIPPGPSALLPARGPFEQPRPCGPTGVF
jgi:hypothetical protein